MEIPRFSYLHNRQEAYQFFKDYGLVVFDDIATKPKLETIKARLEEIISLQISKNLKTSPLKNGNGFDKGILELAAEHNDLRRRLYDVIQDIPELYEFSVNPLFLNIIKDHGIRMPILRTAQFRMDLPEDERFLIPPHQEIKGIRSPNMIFFITALVDISQEKGALLVAPGSYKLGPLIPQTEENIRYQFIPEHLYIDKYPPQQLPMRAGETAMINMYTIHGSSPNHSLETRWSLITRFEDANNMPCLDGDDTLTKFDLKG